MQEAYILWELKKKLRDVYQLFYYSQNYNITCLKFQTIKLSLWYASEGLTGIGSMKN